MTDEQIEKIVEGQLEKYWKEAGEVTDNALLKSQKKLAHPLSKPFNLCVWIACFMTGFVAILMFFNLSWIHEYASKYIEGD